MQAVTKMADLTNFCQTGDFYANYIMGWVELTILTNFSQIRQSTICLVKIFTQIICKQPWKFRQTRQFCPKFAQIHKLRQICQNCQQNLAKSANFATACISGHISELMLEYILSLPEQKYEET